MDSKRAETLAALDAYIQRQRALLAHTRADADRLRTLRDRALAHPETFVDNLEDELSSGSFKLSEQLECAVGPPELDWSLFAGHDTAPLHALASARHLTQPNATQLSAPSSLQQLVRSARRTQLDPVLAALPPLSPSPPPSRSPTPDPQAARREHERAKIRELKRGIACGLTVPGWGVCVRRDVADESVEVDISLDGAVPSPPPPPLPLSPVLQARVRRPTSKVKAQEVQKPKAKAKRKTPPESTPEPPKKRTRGTGKPRPETYKQAWSVEEQHLLERLLEEIPDGEKNRWQKISKRMEGRRTPRQVASRVQKYFAKLKRFGVGVDVEEDGEDE